MKERHPHINAIGFAIDIISAYEKHRRGGAPVVADEYTLKMIEEFVSKLDEHLDEKYGASADGELPPHGYDNPHHGPTDEEIEYYKRTV